MTIVKQVVANPVMDLMVRHQTYTELGKFEDQWHTLASSRNPCTLETMMEDYIAKAATRALRCSHRFYATGERKKCVYTVQAVTWERDVRKVITLSIRDSKLYPFPR